MEESGSRTARRTTETRDVEGTLRQNKKRGAAIGEDRRPKWRHKRWGHTHTHIRIKRRNKCHTLMQPTICDGINDGSNNNDLDGHVNLFFLFLFSFWLLLSLATCSHPSDCPFCDTGDLPMLLWPSTIFLLLFQRSSTAQEMHSLREIQDT